MHVRNYNVRLHWTKKIRLSLQRYFSDLRRIRVKVNKQIKICGKKEIIVK
jgi:hypothetical protein